MWGWDTLNKITFTFELVNISRIHIGSGFAKAYGVDNPVLRRKNRCVVPGSTLKGLLRTALYRVAPIVGKPACNEIVPEKMEMCPACELLGMPNRPSKVFVRDALPTQGADIALAAGIAIDRSSGKVSEGALFTSEYVVPDTQFTFVVEAYDLNGGQLKLLLTGFIEMAESGFGRMRQKMLMRLRDIDGTFPTDPEFEKLRSILEAGNV